MTPEETEDLVAVISHPGFRGVLGAIDESIDRMRDEILSFPLPEDPQSAAIAIYAKRCKAEGAVSLKNAMLSRLKIIKTRYEEAKK